MSNPFEDDDDNVRSYTTGKTNEKEINQYESEIERVLQESVQSTQRSVQRLEHSKQIGANTATELLCQREKLEYAEKNLDDINIKSHETQRNLNSIKSFFGGFFKNKFSRAPKSKAVETTKSQAPSSSKKESKLTQRLNESINSTPGSTLANGPSLTAESRKTLQGTRFEAMDNQIDENLDHMSSALSQLRSLGKALGDEVDEQNEMLDRIQKKTDRNDLTIRRQDEQMRKLL